MANLDNLIPEKSCQGNPLASVRNEGYNNSKKPYRFIDKVYAIIEYIVMDEKGVSALCKRGDGDGLTLIQRLASERYQTSINARKKVIEPTSDLTTDCPRW